MTSLKGRLLSRSEPSYFPKAGDETTGADYLCCLVSGEDRIEPMPRLRRDEEIKMSIPRIPLLKRCNLDLDTSLPRNRCHPRIRLHTGHRAVSVQPQLCGNPRPTSDVEHARWCATDQKVDEVVGIAGSRSVVSGRVMPERRGSASVLAGRSGG